MSDYDNSKSYIEFELQRKIDEQKEKGLAKHSSEIQIMENLLDALNDYITRFGQESNVYAECVLLYVKISKNKKTTEKYMDLI